MEIEYLFLIIQKHKSYFIFKDQKPGVTPTDKLTFDIFWLSPLVNAFCLNSICHLKFLDYFSFGELNDIQMIYSFPYYSTVKLATLTGI